MSTGKRRDRHNIVADILKAAIGGKIKTHIMYKAKLSYAQINVYLPLLIRKGFLGNMKIERKRRIIKMYRTTKKGIEYLDHLEFMNKMWIQQ